MGIPQMFRTQIKLELAGPFGGRVVSLSSGRDIVVVRRPFSGTETEAAEGGG